ncbi:predicted protein [Uncinocarpus reesii 1704]|uniref:Uncharacterized protein n=1 Tax=Uncinocarpus reesii (strain UAMH 1704) TaxID=336963 RepID=C4JS30_UNCRE|nr:uncharacterized protein UREG_05269 [Uncinocarpus reesii 1704]EEP80427.1 predicted protein [Uncinocarpus reesii 1704]
MTQLNTDSGLSEPKKIALGILNIIDYDVGHLIGSTDIDQPQNAMSLTHTFHVAFGNFDVFLEAVAGQQHTYHIKSLNPVKARLLRLPLTRKLLLSKSQLIEPPSPRLLALHRAIAHILHLSGAGEYIDKILRDFEEAGVQEDGTTELSRLVNWKATGWLDGSVEV